MECSIETDCFTTMTAETVHKLRLLIGLNIDSAAGLREAGEYARSAAVAQTLRICGDTREEFAHELRLVMRALGEHAAADSPITGYRAWVNRRELAERGGDRALLVETLRGERVLRAEYDALIRATIGDIVGDVLQRQYLSLKRMQERIRALRDASNASLHEHLV
jgi:uncharacterized protein (TIGR02284 family)